MTDKAKASDSWDTSVARRNGVTEILRRPKGIWTIELRDKDGNLKHSSTETNAITDEGLGHMLGVCFDSTTSKENTWYIMLVSNNQSESTGYTYDAFLDGDGASEFQGYSEATRQEYVDVVTSGSMTNSASKADFSVNSGGTIYGAALVSNNTKGDHASGDFLYCYSLFAASVTVANGDTFTVGCTITISDT